MTEAEQFLTDFLGVQENDFPITLNLKLYGEALEAYVAHIEKKKANSEKVLMQTGSNVISTFLENRLKGFSITSDIEDNYNKFLLFQPQHPQSND